MCSLKYMYVKKLKKIANVDLSFVHMTSQVCLKYNYTLCTNACL